MAARNSPDLLIAWLEALKEDHVAFRLQLTGQEVNEDGSKGNQYAFGGISDLCEASADYCKKLESQALQVEFEEKQQNHPENWTPLRRAVEAIRGLNKLVSGPHEQIPEAFVRRTLAEQYGCKPEEVTWEQIQFEVSGLLPYYPAIHLVATKGAAPTEEEPVPSEPTLAAEARPSREAFVLAVLEEKGWSILDWATEANVSYHTAADYLSGTTRPYRSTRVKLAKALGVKANELPE